METIGIIIMLIFLEVGLYKLLDILNDIYILLDAINIKLSKIKEK